MADPTENNPPEPTPTKPTPPPQESAPEWATNLQRTLEELPGKLSASVTDDDKKGIAEHVHGLFESSGAFVKEGEEGEQPQNKDDATRPPTQQEQQQEVVPSKKGLAGFASWFAGEKT